MHVRDVPSSESVTDSLGPRNRADRSSLESAATVSRVEARFFAGDDASDKPTLVRVNVEIYCALEIPL